MNQDDDDIEWYRNQVRLCRAAIAQAIADNGPDLHVELPVLKQSLKMFERTVATLEADRTIPPNDQTRIGKSSTR